MFKELSAVVECIDLRYISQRSSFTEGGTWNLAGWVEAALRVCRQIGSLLGMSEADVDQTLAEGSKRMRNSDRQNKQQSGQEILSAKSRPLAVQPAGQGSHREKPLPSKLAAQPTLEKAAQ